MAYINVFLDVSSKKGVPEGAAIQIDIDEHKMLRYEINRLHELFELERKDNIDLRHHFAKANEEIERLREALQKIAKTADWPTQLTIAKSALQQEESK